MRLSPIAYVSATLALVLVAGGANAATRTHRHTRVVTPQGIQNRSVYVAPTTSAPSVQNFTLPPAGGPSVYQPISPSGTPELRQRF